MAVIATAGVFVQIQKIVPDFLSKKEFILQ